MLLDKNRSITLTLFWTIVLFAAITSFALVSSKATAEPLTAFPGAEGFGSETPAGRSGKIIKVTNLNNCGSGSLRAAAEAVGPRIIVFEVGGTIALSDALILDKPYVTIAGQTAPSPGITIKGAGITIKTHDILIQHLRIRVGDAPEGPPPANRDALQILGPSAYNVVIDHLSASWAIDENGSTWNSLHDVTINNSIFSEGLNASLHPKGAHSKGILIGDLARNISLIGNLMAHNAERNPRVKGNVSLLVVNNVMYNCGGTNFMSIGSSFGPSLVSVIGNIFINGPNTAHESRAIKVESSAPEGTKVFPADNRASGAVSKYSTPFDPRASSPPIWITPLTLRDSSTVESWVLANAGARPADRDSVDKRIIEEVIERTGRIIDSQKQVGGWPDIPESTRPFPVPANPYGDDDSNGYTNIEEILHRMAAQVEGRHSLP